mmetsp:Transcript_10259/g.26889  ORF Transcript_10259/g.26889 Transcript_10259/m.26889 type:complete len:260 (-) Transcript_10259:1408-2187(-)|eukprot:CAMPEP_0113895012 /NCGR_PEP_ID=MMETSP0780_2-20120614/17092_1 /TAXON_ID=652834 /ORGANISM="Palpitomonas bilix" /LENGTH=259 /DNA_ID=CAMNT_0000885727 /DNA_START=69 /DNA_END=848 /DNA_ORIENTATION=- /assembly_acc=CAM_ASM_000599
MTIFDRIADHEALSLPLHPHNRAIADLLGRWVGEFHGICVDISPDEKPRKFIGVVDVSHTGTPFLLWNCRLQPAEWRPAEEGEEVSVPPVYEQSAYIRVTPTNKFLYRSCSGSGVVSSEEGMAMGHDYFYSSGRIEQRMIKREIRLKEDKDALQHLSKDWSGPASSQAAGFGAVAESKAKTSAKASPRKLLRDTSEISPPSLTDLWGIGKGAEKSEKVDSPKPVENKTMMNYTIRASAPAKKALKEEPIFYGILQKIRV